MKWFRKLLQAMSAELLLFLAVSVPLSIVLICFDAFDRFVALTSKYEAWELDEIATTLSVMGGLGYVFALRHIFTLRREVHRRELAEQEARQLATHDALTGLPNRRFLLENFEIARERDPAPFYVAILDLDGFKAVNDLYGHATGDALLREVAIRLRGAFAEPDFVCRLSGDEFALVIRSLSEVEAVRARIEETLAALRAPVLVGNHEIRVSGTFGVACHPADGTVLGQLLRRADVALYQGKSGGRASIRFYNAQLDLQIEERARIEAAVQDAMQRGSLFVEFQPIVELGGGRVIAFEALARMIDPMLGRVPPQQFIGAAEHTGLILGLSEHLLRLACAAAQQWPEHVRLSFNLSPIQLHDPALVGRMIEIVHDSGLEPSRLEFEITESSLIRDPDAAERVFRRLREVGFRLALDDFGTGYSSLSRLAGFRVDRIKFDRSFVQEIGCGNRHEPVLEALLQLAVALDAEAVAEGIETLEQRDWLLARGCRYGQGYYFGRPAGVAQLAVILANECLPA